MLKDVTVIKNDECTTTDVYDDVTNTTVTTETCSSTTAGENEIRIADLGKYELASGTAAVGSIVHIKDDAYMESPAKLKYKLKTDSSYNETSETIEIELTDPDYRYEEELEDASSETIAAIVENDDILYHPFYYFRLKAVTSGTLQTRFAQHTSMTADNTENESLNYLKNYVYYYEAYAEEPEETLYDCVGGSSPSTSLTTYKSCPSDSVVQAETVNTSVIHPKLSFDYMPDEEISELSDILKLGNENESSLSEDDIISESLRFGSVEGGLSSLGTDVKLDLDAVEKYANMYGVDSNLLYLVMYVNEKTVIPGTYRAYNYGMASKEVYTETAYKEVTMYDTINLDDNDTIKLEGTSALLANLAEEFKGNVAMMLTAYDLGYLAGDINVGIEGVNNIINAYSESIGLDSEAVAEEKNNIS